MLGYCPNTTLSMNKEEVLVISSPFYPSYYPDNIDCFWKITSDEESPNGFIEVTFLNFDTHPEHDFLTVGVGNEIDVASGSVLHLSGGKAPRVATVNGSAMWLRFKTNVQGQMSAGFRLRLKWLSSYGKQYFYLFFIFNINLFLAKQSNEKCKVSSFMV